MGLKAIIILCLIPSILSECTIETSQTLAKRAIYDFSIELLTKVAEEKENHFVTSTLSSWGLLSCISLGAANNTLAELKQVLRQNSHECFNQHYLKIISNISSHEDPDVTVERSSVIFADEGLHIKDEFKNKVAETGVSDIEAISLHDTKAAAATINDYVSRATHDTINDFIAPSDLVDPYIVMIDALFFKGSWQKPFENGKTKLMPFYSENGTEIGQVNMMFTRGSFNTKVINEIDARVLELQYGDSGRYSALFFIPLPDIQLFTVMEKLKSIPFKSLLNMSGAQSNRKTWVQIPRFKIVSDLNKMKELLSDMGLESMFQSQKASFPHLSNIPLYVSEFIQKASIEVTEEGSTASAATRAGFTLKIAPKHFTADKPFMFMIVDKKFEVPLFVGAYSKPSQY